MKNNSFCEPSELSRLLEKASQVYLKNFPESANTAWFGKCIFVSWYCSIATCKFCFRAVQNQRGKEGGKERGKGIGGEMGRKRGGERVNSPRTPEQARRSTPSILAETLITRKLGWRLEFLTGGCDSLPFNQFFELIQKVCEVYNDKVWINLGLFNKEQLEKLKPYVEGVCASIETTNPELHDQICPDKPIKPYEEMLELSGRLGFKKSACIIIGLGEKKSDIDSLFEFIKRNKLDRLTFYALKPVKGSSFNKSPEPEEYAWWIARSRIEFPCLEIMAGLTPKKPEYAEWVLRAGVNAITKFPAIRKFGSEQARIVEQGAINAGRRLNSSLTCMTRIDRAESGSESGCDWEKEIDELELEPDMKRELKHAVLRYINKMSKKASEKNF